MEKTTSTNDIAKNLCGDDEDFVVIADEQTAGKGRLDRSWVSPSGGLYFSLCTKQHPLLSLKTASAMARTIDDMGVTPSLKWPNDVLVDDKKLCGILVENVGERAVVGVGLNVDSSPIDGCTCLSTILGRNISPETVMNGFLTRFYRIEDVMDIYRSYSSSIGRRVVVQTPAGKLKGLVEDIDERGRLILDGDRPVVSGDVIHLRGDNGTS